jgi:Immunoglobulin-like domain of bacterial spore germination/Sporulation and spore germination
VSDRLRAAFEAGTERVPVAPDALGTIRAKVRRRAQRRRRAIAGLAGVATAGVVGAAVLLSSLSPVTPPVPGPASNGGSSTVVTSSPPANPPVTVPVTVPVYFSEIVADRPVLYREYVTTTMPAPGNELMTALQLSIQGAAADPDYGTRWPAGARIQHAARGDVASVDVTGVPLAAGDDPMAVQQLVYTATAVLSELGDPATTVRVTIDGVTVPGGEAVTRASSVDTLAPLWLISPQQGATVAGTFDVHLSGSVWEAAARLRVRDDTGAVVTDEPVLLDKGAPERGEAHVSLTLPPGRYTLETFFLSAQDGRELGLDDHEITVS